MAWKQKEALLEFAKCDAPLGQLIQLQITQVNYYALQLVN
jgi:hypothetical protein